jgi:methionyl-tRNA synthetase
MNDTNLIWRPDANQRNIVLESGGNMSQEQAEQALQSLYEESGARDELADDEAEILLKWAETQIQRLADQNMDDESFDEAYAQIVKLMTRMNRFAARRVDLPLEDQKTSLSRIAESASAVGLAIPEAQLVAYLEQPVAQDGSTHIQGLITLVAGDAGQSDVIEQQTPTLEAPSEPSEPVPTEKAESDDQEIQ